MPGYKSSRFLSTLMLVGAMLSISICARAGDGRDSNPSSAFSCPAGQEDVMQYFAMDKQHRDAQHLTGNKNPLYTEVFPDEDFAPQGYWFLLKSPDGHGFDVDVFDEDYVYLRSTELEWKDNTTFKRKLRDVPLSSRCVPVDGPADEVRVREAHFLFYASCRSYKTSSLGTIVNRLDAPVLMDTGGNLGKVLTRVLHYRYNCDPGFGNCREEEQFFLGKGYGQWQWRHYRNGDLVNTTMLNHLAPGASTATLPCPGSYQ